MSLRHYCFTHLVFLLSLGSYSPLLLAATATEPLAQVIAAPNRFGFVDVMRRAEALSKEKYSDQDIAHLPKPLQDLGYDQYRDIRFQPDKAIWLTEKLPFILRFFHRGFLFNRQVAINLIEAGEQKPMAFNPDLFSYGPSAAALKDHVSPDLGFAGMQILFPLLDDQNYSEVAAFLGASYFRAVAKGLSYGLSARALTVDTALSKGEEFPYFREFWIEKPDKDAVELTLYALLDSASVTGAYRFTIKPGMTTHFKVKVELFMRQAVTKLGIAPLTSMYYHGALSEQFYGDFRPQVHDSDGLLLAFGNGEWLWRPLNNRQTLRVNRFNANSLRGFGLMQRSRNFSDYQDLEAYYQQRPNAWVELSDRINKNGAVELVEIPTDAERNDNIVAHWVMNEPVKAGDQLGFEYQLAFGAEATDKTPGAFVKSSRIGNGGSDSLGKHLRKFVLDFAGDNLAALPAETAVEAIVSASVGKILNKGVQYNPFTKGWRVFFELLPDGHDDIELRCFLRTGPNVLSETWSYQWFQ